MMVIDNVVKTPPLVG